MPEPTKVSATLYSTYRMCPQQALARYQGVYGPTSRASFRGSLAHKVFSVHLNEGEISDVGFEDRCRRLAGEHLGEPMASLHLSMSDFRGIVGEVRDLYERFKRIPTDGFVAAEEEIEAWPDDDLVLRGRIDAVFSEDGAQRIVDWKTGSDLENSDAQLDFYALAWRLVHGSPPVTIEAASVATGEQVLRHPTDDTTDETLRAIREMVEAFDRATATLSDLERTAGPHCKWCPILEDCSEGATAVALLG
ncbi:MAG: PD-(D/E)XK nuclease family protein [Acidimicrobiia bacterium]|nr:PD-(D/E)XK nuclease family protein [Acidimicrobiia bacterium]